MVPFTYHHYAAIDAAAYLIDRMSDPQVRRLYALVYLADLHSLSNYGRFIFGESYLASDDGPLPYGLMIFIDACRIRESNADPFVVGLTDVAVQNGREPFHYLSRSDRLSLDHALKTYDRLPTDELWQQTQGTAWAAAEVGKTIPFASIVQDLPNADDILAYLDMETNK